jgi:hypothetical protein
VAMQRALEGDGDGKWSTKVERSRRRDVSHGEDHKPKEGQPNKEGEDYSHGEITFAKGRVRLLGTLSHRFET